MFKGYGKELHLRLSFSPFLSSFQLLLLFVILFLLLRSAKSFHTHVRFLDRVSNEGERAGFKTKNGGFFYYYLGRADLSLFVFVVEVVVGYNLFMYKPQP